MPGALETLDALRDHPLALVTNKAQVVTLRVLDAAVYLFPSSSPAATDR